MNTFWKKMAAFGFGVAFSLLSATVSPANSGGEGFDFTDEKSASEEWNAMKKQKEEEDKPVIIDASEIEMYITGLVADMEKLTQSLVNDDVTEWHNTRRVIQTWEEAPFNIHGVRENQVRYSTNQEKKILYEGCELIDKFVRHCLGQYWVALDWRRYDIGKQLEATVAMDKWFESKGVEHMKELSNVQTKLHELFKLCRAGQVKNADLGLMDAGLDRHFRISPTNGKVLIMVKGSFLYDLDAHAEAMTKEIILKRLEAIKYKEEELQLARDELKSYAPKLKGLPRPFAKASQLISAVEKVDSFIEECLQEYKKMLAPFGKTSDPRGQFVLKTGTHFEFKSGESYEDAVLRTVKECLPGLMN
jgi:hypothetical protein